MEGSQELLFAISFIIIIIPLPFLKNVVKSPLILLFIKYSFTILNLPGLISSIKYIPLSFNLG